MRALARLSFALTGLATLATSIAARADVVPTIATLGAAEAGPYSVNAIGTLKHMDLGMPWVDGAGRILLAYGDAYVQARSDYPWNAAMYWTRGGTLAWTTDGLTFAWYGTPYIKQNLLGSTDPNPNAAYSGMIAGPLPTYAAQEFDALPSAVTTVAGRDVVHFFTIPVIGDHSGWCKDGHWTTLFSEFATRPTNTNVQFTRQELAMRWPSTSNFAIAAFLTRGDYVYLYGTAAGRSGGMKLARANATEAWDPGGYKYWDGTTWQNDETKGVYVVPAPAGEPSVQFDAARGRFVMTYLDQDWPSDMLSATTRGRIVMRDAPSLEGPWGEEKELLDAPSHDGAYGGFMYPLNGGSALTINVSQWTDYNVYQYRSTLTWRAQDDNLVSDGDFETGGAAYDVEHPWAPSCTPTTCDQPLIWDHLAATQIARSGTRAAKVASTDTAWHDVHQTIAVKPNTDYQFSVWTYGKNVSNAYLGVRTAGAPTYKDSCVGLQEDPSDPHTVIAETHVVSPPATWTQHTVRFNSGPRSLIQVYGGLVGNGGTDVLAFDDVSVGQLELTRDGGFEMQESRGVGWPYATEGTGGSGVDQEMGYSHSGMNNAWINTNHGGEWNAITQVVGVKPNTTYTVKAWVNAGGSPAGYFGVRGSNGAILGQVQFANTNGYHLVTTTVSSGSNTQLKIFGGIWPTASGSWMRIDDISIENPPPIVLHVF